MSDLPQTPMLVAKFPGIFSLKIVRKKIAASVAIMEQASGRIEDLTLIPETEGRSRLIKQAKGLGFRIPWIKNHSWTEFLIAPLVILIVTAFGWIVVAYLLAGSKCKDIVQRILLKKHKGSFNNFIMYHVLENCDFSTRES